MECPKCNELMLESFVEFYEPKHRRIVFSHAEPKIEKESQFVLITNMTIWACNCGAIYHQDEKVRVSKVIK